jgi:ppGpp synthetase/RelA/SpoT-type nucleotidyltranferase
VTPPDPINAAREWYIQDRPSFENLVEDVGERLRALAAVNGVHVEVSGRTKTVVSFVKKAHIRGYIDPRRQTTDLAGVRVVTTARTERDRLAALVVDAFPGAVREDKAPNVKELGYRGVHVTAPVACADGETRSCEIQLRTHGEDAWNKISHELLYKPGLDLPEPVTRNLYVLQALSEVLDNEAERGVACMVDHPLYKASRLLDIAEREYYLRASEPTDRDVALDVLDAVAPLIGDLDEYDDHFRTFVAANDAKIRRILEEYASAGLNLLVAQPEALVVFERLAMDEHALVDAWNQQLPEYWLDDLRAAWGYDI